MARRLLVSVLVPLALAVAGCGSSGSSSATTATTVERETATTTSPSPGPASVVAYFLRDGKVAPVRVAIEPTRAVASAAVNALLAGPPDGYETAVPAGGRLVSLEIESGVATATLSDQLRGLDAEAAAQLVYTLTQFSTVEGVLVLPQPLNDEHGEPLGEPATRGDFENETPAILIESPLPGDDVSSPVRVRGTANAFEATFQLDLRRDGEPLAHVVVMATSGSGERGTFDVQVPYEAPAGAASIVAWEDNQASPPEGDGPLHEVQVPVVLR